MSQRAHETAKPELPHCGKAQLSLLFSGSHVGSAVCIEPSLQMDALVEALREELNEERLAMSC